ncbi:MAG: hypothetical protein ACFFEY_05480 [Candidatus Thorarchaeota archaeon]
MSKAVSFYDWELSFKDKSKPDKDIKKTNFNSLGIADYSFKDFMKKWKDKNLSQKKF